MRFEILGPIRVEVGSSEVAIGARRERILLAALLLHANQCVNLERIVDAMWAERPPKNAGSQVHGCVYRLRKRFATAGLSDPIIVTEPAGYRAHVAPQSVDLYEFRRLRDEARAAAANGEPARAKPHYRSALGLWRGPALDGIDSELIRKAAAALDEERAQAWEECLEIELATGGAGELVAELTKLVQQHPYREGLHGKLMLALYRAGRQADALTAYRHAHRLLRDELGTEPGAELQQLHQAILNRDPDLAAPRTESTDETGASVPIPRQLPADVVGFTGRVEVIQELDSLLPEPAVSSRVPVVISAIGGTAGVGKTALAVHWAHQVADRFPDGQLYVNLRGFDPSRPPMEPAEAIRGFLDALDVAPQRIPASLDAQASLYRSLLSGRRMLVLLDNARDVAQVRPLLPGAAGCLVVVTSRNELSSLLAIEGAHPLTLDVLNHSEAHQLLERRLGAGRLAVAPEATHEIISRCARLPLALAIVAARASARSDFPMYELARELREARSGLDALSDPDPTANLRTALDVSYRTLSADAAQMFRFLALHPGPDLSLPAAASLLGVSSALAKPMLTDLSRAHLVTEHSPDRYSLHDLLRAYASELVYTADFDSVQSAATSRMLDFYLHTAYSAQMMLDPNRKQIILCAPLPGVTPGNFEDPAEAIAWFTGERPILLALIAHSASAGYDTHAWQLAWTMAEFLQLQGHWHDWESTQTTALGAAQSLADPLAEAIVYRSLAGAHTYLGAYDNAYTDLLNSLDRVGRLDDRAEEARIHLAISVVLDWRGRTHEALSHALQAVELAQTEGDLAGQANALSGVGWLHAQLGDFQLALGHCQQALTLQQRTGDRHGQATTWDSLGYAHHHLGDYQQAATCYEHALGLAKEHGFSFQEAETLSHLGDTHYAIGDIDAAREAWRQALSILGELDHPDIDQVRVKLRRLAVSEDQ